MTDSSSEAAEVDPIDVSQPDAKAAAADPSTAAETQGEPSLLDAVETALKGDTEAPPASQQQGQTDPAAPKADAPKADGEEPLPEMTEEEFKKYGPRTQRRIRQFLTERHEKTQKIAELEPKAAEFEKFDTYVRQNNLTTEDVKTTFELAALVRNDPVKAWERLAPIVRQLAEITGNVLPTDLEEEVRLGYITQERARELARVRAQSSLSERRTTEQTQRQQQTEERDRLQRHSNDCRDTANDWESRKKSADPDYALKAGRISEKLKLKLHENQGFPATKQDVVKWLDDIHKDVTAEILRFAPKPKAITPQTGSASPAARAEPKTALEAAELALAGNT